MEADLTSETTGQVVRGGKLVSVEQIPFTISLEVISAGRTSLVYENAP